MVVVVLVVGTLRVGGVGQPIIVGGTSGKLTSPEGQLIGSLGRGEKASETNQLVFVSIAAQRCLGMKEESDR